MTNQFSQAQFITSLDTIVASLTAAQSIAANAKGAKEEIRKAKEQAFTSLQGLISFAISKNNDSPLALIANKLGEFKEFRALLPKFSDALAYSVKDKRFTRTKMAKKFPQETAGAIGEIENPFNAAVIERTKQEKAATKATAPLSAQLTELKKALETAAKKASSCQGAAQVHIDLSRLIDNLTANIVAAQEAEATEAKEMPSIEAGSFWDSEPETPKATKRTSAKTAQAKAA